MPLYEYRCEACGQPDECLEKVSAPESHDCPACGVPEGMKRQVSVAAFALVGSGWYQGSASEPAPRSAEKPAEKAGEKAAGKVAEAPKGGHACGTGGCGCPPAP